MRRLPPVHQATLKAILEHLARVAAHSEKNKMDVKNLAIVFGGVIFGEDDLPKGGDLLSMQSWKDSLMEDLIINASILFDDRTPTVSSLPLPPAPVGQLTPNYTYGSAHTKVATVPGPSQMPIRQQVPPQSSDDFTPRLPARPANSIHPSSRTNPASPTKASMDAPTTLPTPGQDSLSKLAESERPATPIAKPVLPRSAANAPPPPSAASMLIAMQEQDERATSEHHDSTLSQEGTPSSPVPVPESPRTLKSTMPSVSSLADAESMQVTESDPRSSALLPVPGAFPS